MKIKRIKVILILFLMAFFIPFSIKADVSCEKVQDAVDEYNNIVTELETTDCSDTTDNSVVKQCNDLNTRKALQLSKLFKYNDLSDCDNPELRTIIKDNEETCTNVFGSTLKDLTNNVMGIFYIIAPFLLIIFGSIDFSKIVVMNDPKMIKTARTNFFKRLAAFVLLYMVPAFVSLVLNFNFSNYSLTGNVYSCKTEFAYQMNRWDITYIPPVNEEYGRSSGSIGEFNGLYTIRSTAPISSDSAYQGYQNVGQCVWYARSRAIEITQELINNGKIDNSTGNTIIKELKNSSGNAGDWDSNNAAQKFKTSTNLNDVKAPAIIVWKKVSGSYRYGHVAIIEDVDTVNQRVKATEGWSNAKNSSGDTISCPGTWTCIEFKPRDYSMDEYLNGFGKNYTGSYAFSNYIYFTELK